MIVLFGMQEMTLKNILGIFDTMLRIRSKNKLLHIL